MRCLSSSTGSERLLLRAVSVLTMALLLLPTTAQAVEGLYEQMLQTTRQELLLNLEDTKDHDDLKIFAASIASTRDLQVPVNAVDLAISDDPSFCTVLAANNNVPTDTFGSCESIKQSIRSIIEREMNVRSLGRSLQMIAAGEERTVMGWEASPVLVPARAQALIRLWSADDTVNAASHLRIRSVTVPENDAMRSAVEGVASALATIRDGNDGLSAYSAAVVRYSLGGYRLLSGQRPDFPPPSSASLSDTTPYTDRRWPEVERALASLRAALLALPLYPPAAGEIVLFSFPASLQKLLPQNVQVWAYTEKVGTSISGDTGIAWIDALTPIFPQLCNSGDTTCSTPLTGGAYPAPLEEGRLLCSHPLARMGYLCRDLEADTGDVCDNNLPSEPGTIILTSCSMSQEARDALEDPAGCTALSSKGGDTCAPESLTQYPNTIGNQMCYMNACLRSTFEKRYLPGRDPATVQDDTSPSDACIRPDPQLGGLTFKPGVRTWLPPAYRPELLLKTVDASLCTGLTPSLFPALCSFNIASGLYQVRANPSGAPGSAIDQDMERQNAMRQLQEMTAALGKRTATRLFADYLAVQSTTLGELTSHAALLLSEVTHTHFPTEMCPLNDASGQAFLETPLCENTQP